MEKIGTTAPAPSLPDFGLSAAVWSTRVIDLSTARDEEKIEIGGTFLWAIDASDLAAEMEIRLNSPRSDKMTWKKSQWISKAPFGRIIVTNAAQAGKSITLAYTIEGKDNIIVGNPADAASEVTVTKSNTLDSHGDVTLAATATTLILAADTDRREIIITNLVGNPETLRIGDSGAAAANGDPLAPGETIILTTTDAVYGYNPGGAGQDVTVIETKE